MRTIGSDFAELTDPMILDEALLREVQGLRDPIGYLSVSLTLDRSAPPAEHPPWAIDLRNRLAELRANLREEERRDAWRALDDLSGRAAALLEEISDPVLPGTGRVAFIPLSGGEPIALSLQAPVPARVVLEPDPFLRPLLTALDQARPLGVVVAGGQGLHAWKWSVGVFTPLLSEEFDRHEVARGGVRGSGARGARTSTAPDATAHREEKAWARFAVDVAEALTSDEHLFDRVVVFADERATPVITPVLEERFVVDVNVLNVAGKDLPGAIAHQVAGRCVALRHDEERAEGAAIQEQVAAAGAAVVGLAGVVAALNDRRVQRLVIDATHRWSGRVLPDGRLDLGGSADEQDTRLGERLIEAALEQGASISVHEDAATTLGDTEAVGAFLRW